MATQIAVYGRIGGEIREIITRADKLMAVGSMVANLPCRASDSGEASQWFSFVGFERVAGELLEHQKGDLVSIQGQLQVNAYINRNEETVQELQILVESVVSARTSKPGRKRRTTPKPPPPVPKSAAV
ncbi:single-stranded DNA-binding protein [Aestuariirhabdus sp. Z084]|uniref:single-stranded DNA-binding protein n=1 Tax=Aestuariirhabdus haliotis TaxID=2918751 RepID=UPI00201B3A66|nr:single-stranded DNA-binding protein [Aestuariirhabdus haliotis]MCL6416347.1 single-stranded DNA-binding protein [Aestuariirhabdus haliotis]MCL6420336.1 single-stranded DNA-binding protein [Aestuariirhabdus haliotis]